MSNRAALNFRPLAPGDQADCLRLFDGNCPGFFDPGERAGYVEFLRRPTGPYEVGLTESSLVAAYGLEPATPGVMTIRWVVVAPEVQGRGVGRQLMERAIGQVRDQGCSRLRIAASHRSAPFFSHFGALELARIPDGWGPGMHRVDMELTV